MFSFIKIREVIGEAAGVNLAEDEGRQPGRGSDRDYLEHEDPSDSARVYVIFEYKNREHIDGQTQEDWGQDLPLHFLNSCQNIKQLYQYKSRESNRDNVRDKAFLEDEQSENNHHRALINTHRHPDQEGLERETSALL